MTCVYSAIASAWDKYLSLCTNYPKGEGEHFALWLREKLPNTLLYHVIGAKGSRYGLSLMAVLAVYMHRRAYFEYASHVL